MKNVPSVESWLVEVVSPERGFREEGERERHGEKVEEEC